MTKNKNNIKRGTPEFDTLIKSSFTKKNVLKLITPYDIIKYDLLPEALKRNNYKTLNALFAIIKNCKKNKSYDFSATATRTLEILISYDKNTELFYKTCQEYTTNLINLGANTELIDNYHKNFYKEYKISINESNNHQSFHWKYDGNIDITSYYEDENTDIYTLSFYIGLLNSVYKDDIYNFDLTNWCYDINTLSNILYSDKINIKKLKHYNKLMIIYRHFLLRIYENMPFMWSDLEEFLHSDIQIDQESVDVAVNYIVKTIKYMDRFDLFEAIKLQIQNMLLSPVIEERIYFNNSKTEDNFFILLESKVKPEIAYTELKVVQKYKEKRKEIITEIMLNNYLFLYKDVMSIVCKYI